MTMKRSIIAVVIGALLVIAASYGINALTNSDDKDHVRVGIVYVGDAAAAYTTNFMHGVNAVEYEYGDKVEVISKFNVPEGGERPAFDELIEAKCDIIFSTSYGYGETAKKLAAEHPEIEFCQISCSNANVAPILSNYHNAMGEIHEGRYVSGVVAGMKLKQLLDDGAIAPEQTKVGYVAAYPMAEVISGYTAFLLGVRSVVPDATMLLVYTNSWSNYTLEKEAAERLISEGCAIISQHSDTEGVAFACENANNSVPVYCVTYNAAMMDIAPDAYLTGCRIDWEPYMAAAVGAVFDGRKIESCVRGNVHKNDVSAGFDRGWVSMLHLNEREAAPGTAERVEELIKDFKKGRITVFKGNYVGVDPFNPEASYDLNRGYTESEKSSAPSFHYVLQDIIKVIE